MRGLRTTSLRLRVIVGVLALVTALLAGLGLLVNAVLADRLHDDLRNRLTDRARFGTLLRDDALGDQQLADRLTGQGITAVARAGGSEAYGRVRPDLPPAGTPDHPPPGTPASTIIPSPPITERDGVLSAELQIGRFTVTLSASDAEIRHTLAQLRAVELVAGGGTVLVLGLLLSVVVGSALAPLRRMTALAGRIAAGDRGRRLRPTRPGTDLGRTAVAFDRMLDALEASNDQARSAEERMRHFLAEASHDLRTPIAGLLAASESLLRDDPGRFEREDRLVAMVREARRSGRLVDDLLLMARLDADEPDGESRWRRIDLADLAGQVAAAQRLLAPDAEVRVEAAGPAHVVGDPEQLTRVLANLGDNARRAAGPSGRVTFAVARTGTGVTVEVTDDGPGVPPADRDRIFSPLVRLDGEPTRDRYGLGLPIARGLARLHGGDLSCELAAAGARFVLVLPAAAQPPTIPGRPMKSSAEPATRTQQPSATVR